ncbi:hypothetical protein FQR65_LT16115 [Abscondita terminalis]|nr:hypothetical protein FQR65_LT16115 [Abscondita terminalis]
MNKSVVRLAMLERLRKTQTPTPKRSVPQDMGTTIDKPNVSRQKRLTKKPGWLSDYVCDRCVCESENEQNKKEKKRACYMCVASDQYSSIPCSSSGDN